MRFPVTRAKDVSECARLRFSLMMSSTWTPLIISASPTSERWHRHGTASEHMIAAFLSEASFINRFMPSSNLAVCM
jgi:hypothetical protein